MSIFDHPEVRAAVDQFYKAMTRSESASNAAKARWAKQQAGGDQAKFPGEKEAGPPPELRRGKRSEKTEGKAGSDGDKKEGGVAESGLKPEERANMVGRLRTASTSSRADIAYNLNRLTELSVKVPEMNEMLAEASKGLRSMFQLEPRGKAKPGAFSKLKFTDDHDLVEYAR